jgi:hypothetical protein
VREQLRLGDWVQVQVDGVPDEDGGEIVAVKGDIGHVVQEETSVSWAMVWFERTGRTIGVPPSDLVVLADASGVPYVPERRKRAQ